MQYYPTDLRICNYFTYLHFNLIHIDEENARAFYSSSIIEKAKENIEKYNSNMKENMYKFKKDWYKIPSYSTYKFQEEVINKNIKSKDFELKHKPLAFGGNNYSIVDLFAGQGEWLNLYKQYSQDYGRMVKTLAIELSEERFLEIEKQNETDYIYNSAFEDVELPKECISLLDFNPPYDTVGGERLTKVYLQEIIDRELLIPNSSFVDFVIREDDFRDCLDLLQDHFSIIEETLFKAPTDEYSKFKQIVFTAKYKSTKKPLLDTRWHIEDRQKEKSRLVERIDNIEVINLMKISHDTYDNCRCLPECAFKDKIKNIQMKNNNKEKISSDGDMSWNWFRELVQIKTDTIGGLTVPKKLKQGEIVNVISSGILNGRVENHIISGGTKQVEETIKTMNIGENGKEFKQIEIRKVNKPYFNILIGNGEIKKLLDKEVKVVENCI